MIKKLLIALMVIGSVSAEPITVFTTKKFEGDTVIVSQEYMEKVVLFNVYRGYTENGKLVFIDKQGKEKTFIEANTLWSGVK